MCLWVGPPSGLEDVVCLPIKLSYNSGPSVASNFCYGKTELRELQTPLTSTALFLGFNLVETTSAQPQRGGGQTQQKPNSAKLLLWKLNVKKPQHSGSDKKPACWKLGQQKQTRQKAHTAQSQIPEDLRLG